MKHLITKIIMLLSVAGLAFSAVSCEPEGITDTSDFMLYYPGITDIGPSTNFNLSPTYHGEKPSQFAIDKITLDGEAVSSECFSIDPDSGLFSMSNTDNLETGLYSFTISCVSGGKRYTFEDVITINMMKAVPDGITADPAILTVKLGDIISPSEDTVLPTSQIKTDGTSVSIKSYIMTNVRRNGVVITDYEKLFEVSSNGVVSIIGNNPDFLPGEYVFDFKLTTYLVNEEAEEGLFSDALTINVTSEPLGITYNPANTEVESGYAISSEAPLLNGSLDGIQYSIKSIVRNGAETVTDAPITIDPTSGVISVADKNALEIGDTYTISITATNAYGTKDFDNVYTITVVDFIEPITTLEYENVTSAIEMVAFENPVKTMDGESVTYSLVDLTTELEDLRIDAATGTVYAEKGNRIPLGTHNVKVKVQNIKSEVTATFTITVVANPNMFTFVHWGNNLGLTPATDYASQYRFTKKADYTSAQITVADNDLPEGVTVRYEIDETNSLVDQKNQPEYQTDESKWVKVSDCASIDANTGTITFTDKAWSGNPKVMMFLVKVTAGDDPDSQITVKVPVFIETSQPVKPDGGFTGEGITVQYTPFVIQINPRTGGKSLPPAINGLADPANFRMEYRTDYSYANINGPENQKSGLPSTSGSFMRGLYDTFYAKLGKSPNYGQKWPLSYYQGTKDGWLNTYALGYINTLTPDNPNGQYEVCINPGLWVDGNGKYANGAFIGRLAYSVDGTEPNSSRFMPVAIWFDEKF